MCKYLGVMDLEILICCKKEVSGAHFSTKIAGHDVLIVFPSIPKDYDGSHCDIANGELEILGELGKGKIRWGGIHAWPEGIFSVERMTCCFSAIEDIVAEIYQDFPRWKEKVRKLHIINTGNYLSPKQKTLSILVGGVGIYDGLEIFEFNKGKPLEYIGNHRTTDAIRLHIPSSSESYSINELKRLFINAGSDKEIALAYELLITAYNALERSDFRSAVILGGSAVEKAVLERMRREYNDADYEKVKEKHRMLGGKFKWLEENNILIPIPDYKVTITDVRNDAVHEGKCPTFETTKKCLENCKILIEEYNPSVLEM